MDNRDLIYDDELILSGIIGICNTYDYMKQAVGIKDIDNDVVSRAKFLQPRELNLYSQKV
jgi:hypothetical protein